MKDNFFVSICIPSYNRPTTLLRLLNSIDSERKSEIQIVICEDKSPAREEIRSVVEDFKATSEYSVKYVENESNYGFDKNWRELSIQADGEYLIYMGDDDGFVPNTLDNYMEWLNEHRNYCYVLRSYVRTYENRTEYFRYYSKDMFFEPGIKAYEAFFMKSVSMSGFTIKRECVLDYTTTDLDNTLLFQLYLVAEVCLKYPSAYCNIPFARLISDDVSYFGNSDVEKKFYTPGQTVSNNLNFIKSYFKITEYIDNKHQIDSTKNIKLEFSKYSFYTLSSQRKYGIRQFNIYCRELRRNGLDASIYFYIYYIGLLLFGKRICLTLIYIIKKIIGRRLQL